MACRHAFRMMESRTNRVKQGCIMATTLLSMFSAMLTNAFLEFDAGFPIRYRFDGKLFILRRLQAKSKVQTDVLDKLLYADGLAENANSETKNNGLWIACQKHGTIFTIQSPLKRLR